MANGFEIIARLTSEPLLPREQSRMLRDFARALGWEPSDQLDPGPELEQVTNGHLIIEHGLENSAVITFLISPATLSTLPPEHTKKILEISYNNLVDWHLYVEPNKVTYVFNRTEPPERKVHALSQSDVEAIKSSMFDQITGVAPNPNIPALDDALVETISFWKRNLAAELANKPSLSDYAALFNAIIFVRAAEDHASRLHGGRSQTLLEEWARGPNRSTNLRLIIQRALKRFVNGPLPRDLFNPDNLRVFDELNKDIAYELLSSFYKSRKVPYSYDFAIMSKHALSRIYEKYVAELSFEETAQLSFVPSFPKEDYTKSLGAVYTPQFIARFFARFVREQMPPSVFREIKTLDPACGSGIFLRTMLEFQCAPTYDGISSDEIKRAFNNVVGLDIDENAAQATRLSLSLLYLVLMSGKLPSKLRVVASDAIEYFSKHEELQGGFDVVVTNPPFIPVDRQPAETRELVANFLGDLATGRPDLYLPFLKIAIDSIRPGGYGLFVLPSTFLKQASAHKIRALLYDTCWIRCLVDLSAIPVFEGLGTYVVLLIFQKKPAPPVLDVNRPSATIIICQDFVGHALQEYLDGRRNVETDFYTIFNVDQDEFAKSEWIFRPPSESKVYRKISRFGSLSDVLRIRQGLVTGADSIFIVPKEKVPHGEEAVWAPLLRDRDMRRYVVPAKTAWFVFYPFIEGEKLSTNDLRSQFPETWRYLRENEKALKSRRSASDDDWWMPTRPRAPSELFRPKLVTPHLVLLPKFALDAEGKYAVSRAPYLYPVGLGSEIELLKYYLAILNSTVGAWLISTHSDKYSRGYARLEVGSLRSMPSPDPAKLPSPVLLEILRLADLKLDGEINPEIDRQLDRLVADAYGLTDDERLIVGFEGHLAKDQDR